MSTASLLPLPDAELTVGAIAHGGHCVARVDGRVVFVRHTLPGERVRVRFTEATEKASLWRADAVEVVEPSPDRVASLWPQAGPGGVGGGELAHVALEAQRRWKATVVVEQFRRLAGLDVQVEVEGVPGDVERGGLGYRTRIDLVADPQGRAGMYRHRSHEVVALETMPLATQEVVALAEREGVFSRRFAPGARIEVVAPRGGGPGLVLVDGLPTRGGRVDRRPQARRSVTESVVVGGHELAFRVAADGFWQVHRQAPAVLADAVLAAVGDVAGARVVDLYCGAGLFTRPLADVVGANGTVAAVESDERAVRDARRTLHAHPQVELHHATVHRALGRGMVRGPVECVVLDPPRQGAGRRVVEQIATLRPRRVVYVACDPAALARDVAYFAELGYGLDAVRAFDLFPHTHHVECVAVLSEGDHRG